MNTYSNRTTGERQFGHRQTESLNFNHTSTLLLCKVMREFIEPLTGHFATTQKMANIFIYIFSNLLRVVASSVKTQREIFKIPKFKDDFKISIVAEFIISKELSSLSLSTRDIIF